MADQVIFAPMRATDAANNPAVPTLSGSPRCYVYASGTATLVDVYDADGVALTNPVLADANGVFPPIYADGDVRVVVTDANGVTLPGYPVDPAPKAISIGAAASAISFTTQDNLPENNVQSALEFVADQIEATNGGLGDMAAKDQADLTQTQTVWNTGTNTTESLISPAKLDAKINAERPVFTSADQTITTGGQIIMTHGLGAIPRQVSARLKCLTTEAGYAVNDEVMVNLVNNSTSGTSRLNGVTLTSTQIIVRFSNDTNVFAGANKTTGAAVLLTNANWALIVTAAG